jgi:hypothetical protein
MLRVSTYSKLILLWLIRSAFSSSADINECLDNNGNCEDVCIDTEDSFMCQCLNGRVLAADNRTCEGILILIFGNSV